MKTIGLILIVPFFCGIVSPRKALPKYVAPCSLSDPNLERCMLENAAVVVKNIKGGDKEYKIPSLSPLRADRIDLNPGDLQIKLRNVVIEGIDTLELKSITHDVDKREFRVDGLIPKLNVTCDYEIHGRILVLPIEGNGYMETISENINVTTIGYYDIVEKGGEKYATFSQEKSKLESVNGGMKFRMDNLFNGDKLLGDEMNKFLNENWLEASKQFVPAFNEVIKTIIFDVINRITTVVPFDEIFLP